ncbi:MAG: hypothetical protein KGL39_30935 [Patescibacteria group bacterium]|nr:hypothetical protein [Patescibacteria group bacterium]
MANRINRVQPSSLGDRCQLIVEPCKDGSGNWYWAVKVDGEVYADGEAESRMVAQSRAVGNYDDWLEKQ